MYVSVPMPTDSHRHAPGWEAAPGDAVPVRQFKLINSSIRCSGCM